MQVAQRSNSLSDIAAKSYLSDSSNRRNNENMQSSNGIEIKKLKDINRRLNDLLNQKDNEIIRLSNKILDAGNRDSDSTLGKSPGRTSKMGRSPIRRPPLGNKRESIQHDKYASNDYTENLSDKLRESER